MNLNSYMGLMGHTYREVQTAGGAALAPALPGEGFEVTDPDYVVTLDADSVLLPEYCLRLVHLLEQQQHQDNGDRADPLQRVPRVDDPAGADRGRDHRPAAHRAPGTHLLQRHVLGRRERGDPEAGARLDRRDVLHRRLGDQAVHQGPHGHRGHRVHHRPGAARLAAVQLPGAALLLRDPAGLRVAVHPAPPLGQRRPADPGQAAPHFPRPPRRRQPDQAQRAVPALELHGLHLLELGQPADPARLPVQRHPDQPAARRDRAALLHRHGQRPALLRLQAPRRVPHLRLQPDPARRQPGRHPLLHRPGHHRVQGTLRPDAEGPQPHRRRPVPSHCPVPPHRPRGLHVLPRLREQPQREHVLRGAERRPCLLRGRGVHRPAQLGRRPVDPRHRAPLPVHRAAPGAVDAAEAPAGGGAHGQPAGPA